MVYTHWTDGYLMESVYGTSLIIDTNTQTRSLGVLSADAIHPSPRATLVYAGTGVNKQEVADGSEAWKTIEELKGSYFVTMLDGILPWLVMGKSSTAGGGPYVHTVTPPTPVAGVLPDLPSLTIQHDLIGTSDPWGTQYKGCKISQLMLRCNQEDRLLDAVVDWVAQRSVNAGFVSTNEPVFAPTAVEQEYHIKNMAVTFDSSPVEQVISIEFTINPDFIVWRDSSKYLKALIESTRKKYILRMIHSPTSSVFYDEVVAATSNVKDMQIKWTRSVDDYIQLDLLDCKVLFNEQKSPTPKTTLMAEVIIEPTNVSFTISDMIPGATYGE